MTVTLTARWITRLLALLALSCCSYTVQKGPKTPSANLVGSVGFSQIQSTTLGPKCSRCHSWISQYPSVLAHLSQMSDRIQSINPAFQMPPPGNTPLTDEEKATLLGWISQGGPEEAGQPAPAPQPPPGGPAGLNFAAVSAQVFQGKCIHCHDADFDTFAHALPLIGEISFRTHAIGTDSQMPPSLEPQLTADELKLLDAWIASGAPETER